MSHYYQTFYEDLKLTGKSNRTIQIYEKHLQKIERFYNKSPEQINEEELRRYLISMKDEKHYSESFFKQAISAFRFFYANILEHADWKTLKFIKPQKERRLPDVLSREEVKLILSHVRVPRQKAFLFTLYSLGLRLSEGLNLRIGDIDSSSRMMVHVRAGKGKKDRYVPLPQATLDILRKHWRTHRHPSLIFPAPGRGENRSSFASASDALSIGAKCPAAGRPGNGHSKMGTLPDVAAFLCHASSGSRRPSASDPGIPGTYLAQNHGPIHASDAPGPGVGDFND